MVYITLSLAALSSCVILAVYLVVTIFGMFSVPLGLLQRRLARAYVMNFFIGFCHVTSEQLLEVLNLCVCRISVQKASVVAGFPCRKLRR